MTERASGDALTLTDVAERVGGQVVGDGSIQVEGIGPVEEAGPDQLAFLGARRYTRYAADSAAAAFLVAQELESSLPEGASRVVVDDAYPAMQVLLKHFHPPRPWTAAVHPTAVLGRGVSLGDGVEIGPYAVVEDDATIGDGTRIGAHCVVGRGSTVGNGTRLHPHVVLYEDTVVGDRVILHSGVRLGPDGFGYTQVDGVHAKIPQVGRCVVEDDVEIGANTAIDRGSLGDTIIGRGSKLDNLVHVAHNVRVGAGSLLAAMVGIAGSTRLGKGVFMGGQSGAVNAIEIGDGAKVTVQSGVIGDVDGGGTYSGFPARPHRDAMRSFGHVAKLPDLAQRVKRLEADVDRLSKG